MEKEKFDQDYKEYNAKYNIDEKYKEYYYEKEYKNALSTTIDYKPPPISSNQGISCSSSSSGSRSGFGRMLGTIHYGDFSIFPGYDTCSGYGNLHVSGMISTNGVYNYEEAILELQRKSNQSAPVKILELEERLKMSIENELVTRDKLIISIGNENIMRQKLVLLEQRQAIVIENETVTRQKIFDMEQQLINLKQKVEENDVPPVYNEAV